LDRDLLASSRRPNLSAELGRYRDGELDGELEAEGLPGKLNGGRTSILFGEGALSVEMGGAPSGSRGSSKAGWVPEGSSDAAGLVG
jgi:hypothetical protein